MIPLSLPPLPSPALGFSYSQWQLIQRWPRGAPPPRQTQIQTANADTKADAASTKWKRKQQKHTHKHTQYNGQKCEKVRRSKRGVGKES